MAAESEHVWADDATTRGRAERVLVVDDSSEIRDLLRLLLLDAGYDVAVASDPDEALSAIGSVPPDLIVLEVVVGHEPHGIRMLDGLDRNPATSAIPVVLCTCAAELVRDMPDEVASRFAGIVLKPFDVDDLLWGIRIALDSPAHRGHDRPTARSRTS